jgi:hypothetical protein
MLNNISWADYAAATGIILVIYYGVVWLIYFKNDNLRSFLRPQKESTSILQRDKENVEGSQSESNLIPSAHNKNTVIRTIPEVLMDIQGIITDGAFRKFQKEELFTALKIYLQQNATGEDVPEREVINQAIIAQCERDCSLRLNEEDVRVLWIK